jgi:hypothetical protein
MAADEDMAVRFYQVGNAADLAKELITVLRSPELQRSMGRQNFAAGLEMTIANVVRNYLRWFELNKCKKTLLSASGRKFGWLRSLFSREHAVARPGTSLVQNGIGNESYGHEPAGTSTQSIDFVDPLA